MGKAKTTQHHDPENVKRGAWARAALIPFCKKTYGGDHPDKMHAGDLTTAIQDLITDLFHFANIAHSLERCELEPMEILQRAKDMYEAELIDPDGTGNNAEL